MERGGVVISLLQNANTWIKRLEVCASPDLLPQILGLMRASAEDPPCKVVTRISPSPLSDGRRFAAVA
ncbi:unnamed protein product [Arctogadus glacialis]